MKRIVLLVLLVVGCSSPPPPPPSSGDCVAPDEEDEDVDRQPQAAPSCDPMPFCPHKGTNKVAIVHNRCADRSPNIAWNWMFVDNDQVPDLRDPPAGFAGLGCDVDIGGRFFDAMSWDSKRQHRWVWEVKTHDWSNPYKYDDSLRSCTLNRMLDTFRKDCLQVLTCNRATVAEEDKFTYVMGFSDAGLYWAVVNYLAKPDNYEREIMSHVRALGLADDPRVFCTVENLQRCR